MEINVTIKDGLKYVRVEVVPYLKSRAGKLFLDDFEVEALLREKVDLEGYTIVPSLSDNILSNFIKNKYKRQYVFEKEVTKPKISPGRPGPIVKTKKITKKKTKEV
jgi:tRNA splicing ligase